MQLSSPCCHNAMTLRRPLTLLVMQAAAAAPPAARQQPAAAAPRGVQLAAAAAAATSRGGAAALPSDFFDASKVRCTQHCDPLHAIHVLLAPGACMSRAPSQRADGLHRAALPLLAPTASRQRRRKAAGAAAAAGRHEAARLQLTSSRAPGASSNVSCRCSSSSRAAGCSRPQRLL